MIINIKILIEGSGSPFFQSFRMWQWLRSRLPFLAAFLLSFLPTFSGLIADS